MPKPATEVKPETLDLILGGEEASASLELQDFFGYSPAHKYIYRPTGELWPASTVNARLPWPLGGDGRPRKPAEVLDSTRSVESMTWHPGFPELVQNRLVRHGWIEKPGANTYNLYKGPMQRNGNPRAAQRWRDHLQCLYLDTAAHMERWFAHRIQFPGIKINHAMVMGGPQGIGKDTLLEPVKYGVGPWNFQEISPVAMLGRFNPWVRSVILRVSEARDLGEVDRFKFYEHLKTLAVSPPDTIACDEKFVNVHQVFNVLGLLMTTNHKTGGLYLPADDRRHFVAWSDIEKTEFNADYWMGFWAWYDAGGIWDVVAYLRELDLSAFNPKAPPEQTDAWWAIVNASTAPEESELEQLIDDIGRPTVLTLEMLVDAARLRQRFEVVADLTDRTKRRGVPHRLEYAGYVFVRNPAAKEGLWRVGGRKCAIYGQRLEPLGKLIGAARGLAQSRDGSESRDNTSKTTLHMA